MKIRLILENFVRHLFQYRFLLKLTREQIDWLNECTEGTWTINKKTGLVDVEGRFGCEYQNLKDFKGVRFGTVTGNFNCSRNKLTSLVGAPQNVGWSFRCHHNELTSLVGAPQKVGVDFYCSNNKLTSLEGAPQEVGVDFDCENNQLTSLEGAPQEVGVDFNCSHNKLTSLEGAPQKVGGRFNCHHNKLTSLVGAPQKVGWVFNCSYNKISSSTLEMIWEFMCEKKVDYWTALFLLKSELESGDWKLLSKELDENLSKDAQRSIPILSRFGAFK
jgi:hypothetical protein